MQLDRLSPGEYYENVEVNCHLGDCWKWTQEYKDKTRIFNDQATGVNAYIESPAMNSRYEALSFRLSADKVSISEKLSRFSSSKIPLTRGGTIEIRKPRNIENFRVFGTLCNKDFKFNSYLDMINNFYNDDNMRKWLKLDFIDVKGIKEDEKNLN